MMSFLIMTPIKKDKPGQRRQAMLSVCLTLMAVCLLSACAVGPDFVPPRAESSDQYAKNFSVEQRFSADGKTQHISANTTINDEWWTLFGSASLNAVVEQALVHNQTLAASQASLRQSQHNVQAAYGVFFPKVDIGAEAIRARSAPAQTGLSTSGTVYNLVTVSGSISYVFDVFGGERRAVEAALAQMSNQSYLTKAAYLMLSANVVNTVIAHAAYAEQIRLNQELIDIERKQLKTTQVLYNNGTIPYSSVLSLQSLIASNEAAIAPLKQKLAQSEDLLATLQGVTPAQLNLPEVTLRSLSLPIELPLSLPSDLIRQRPDILSAQAQLHAASAEIGVATAAMFPSISLSGNVGIAGRSWGNLSAGNGKFWNVGPSISLPLFQGGTFWYQRQAAIDAYQVAQANYRQTVLSAFAQVADTLGAIDHDAAALQARADAKHAAQQALQLVQANYSAGMTAYLDVYTADVQTHQANIDYWQAVAQRYQDTVALYVALGGGWWNNSNVVMNGQDHAAGDVP